MKHGPDGTLAPVTSPGEAPSSPGLRFLDTELDQLRRADLLRLRPPPLADPARSFGSNDYLDLARRLVNGAPSGAAASRLVVGEHDEHRLLEEASAAYVSQPDAIAFTSGYAANVGLVSALAEAGDVIVSDALNHASIIDGARLSRARIVVTPHLDAEAVDRAIAETPHRRAFVVTESYFSMDADSPDVARLRAICDHHGAALLVDEAHALGVLGPNGRGVCAQAGVRPDAIVGTYGKAFGAGGAFAAGCSSLVAWLWNRARSFVFSTGLSPGLARMARAGITASDAEPERRERVLAAATAFRRGLRDLGVVARGFGPIVPWVIGASADALRMAERLRELGFAARAIRPPTVPEGTARIRWTVTAATDDDAIARALEAVGRALRLEAR